MFIDRIKVKFCAGKGGNGVVSWTRAKFIPKGGPAGGNGGRGGSIYLEANSGVHSLEWFHLRRLIKAEVGKQGGSNKCQGGRGKDLIVKVPLGTQVYDELTQELITDLTEEGQKFELCKGGRGGRGNACFATPTNRAPIKCTAGSPGQERDVLLELKLIADVGLVGFPNAGKSTLLNALTKASAKVGAYPFTTLNPNLGYIEFPDYTRMLLADIPGLIEGACDNRGLGHEFLRHIERSKGLLFMLDASGIDGREPLEDFLVLQKELKAHHPELLERSFLVCLNKMDVANPEYVERFYEGFPYDKAKVFEISAHEGSGLDSLLEALIETFPNVQALETASF